LLNKEENINNLKILKVRENYKNLFENQGKIIEKY